MGEQRRGQDPPPGAPRAHRPRQRPPRQGPHGLRHKWTLGGSLCRPRTEQCAGERSWCLQVFRVSLLILVADNPPPFLPAASGLLAAQHPLRSLGVRLKGSSPTGSHTWGPAGPRRAATPPGSWPGGRLLLWAQPGSLGALLGEGAASTSKTRSPSARPPARPHALASGSIRASRWWPNTLSTPYPRPSRCGRRRAQ